MLALVDVLGVFTSEIGFCTPKIWRSDVLWLHHKILYVPRQKLWRIYQYWEFGHLISPPSLESQVCVTAVILDKEFIQWMTNGRSGQPQTAHCLLCRFSWQVLNNYCDDHMSHTLERKICVRETLPFFFGPKFCCISFQISSILFQYLFNFFLINERTMFLYKIFHFCSRHDVFLSEWNASIWEKSETINLRTYPTH